LNFEILEFFAYGALLPIHANATCKQHICGLQVTLSTTRWCNCSWKMAGIRSINFCFL